MDGPPLSCLIWHPDGRRAALLDGALPTLTVQAGTNLSEALSVKWSLDALLLHDGGWAFGRADLVRFQALTDILPEPLSWHPWTGQPLLNARPWQCPGWPHELQELFSRGGLKLQAFPRLVSQHDLCAVYSAQTQRGLVYFKISDTPREVAVSAHLSSQQPDRLPQILAFDPEQCWQISASADQLLETSADLDHWLSAVQQLAQFQCSDAAPALAGLGCPSQPTSALQNWVDEFLADTSALSGWGLEQPTIQRLQEARPQIWEHFSQLLALGLPEGPSHGDAHPRNAVYSGSAVRWFDWDQTCARLHPFLDLGWFLAFLSHPARRELPVLQRHPDAISLISRHYLQALGCSEAEAVLPLAIPLSLLARAVRYDQRFRAWSGTVPGIRPQYVPYYLRWASQEVEEVRARLRLDVDGR